MAEDKICFVIAPIGELESDTRKRSDQILKHIISPAAQECGYKALRADQISEPGIITSQVIQHIVDDPLVVADLTDRNPNVFYELAIRHAIKKPLVQIIKKGETIPFDVAGTRTVYVDHHDLDSVDKAKDEITKQIQSVEKDATKVDTPISVAIDLQNLRQSDKPEQRSLADIVTALSDLRSAFIAIDKKISDPKMLIPPDYLDMMRRRSRSATYSREYLHEMKSLISITMDEISSSKMLTEDQRRKIQELLMRIDFLHKRMIDEDS